MVQTLRFQFLLVFFATFIASLASDALAGVQYSSSDGDLVVKIGNRSYRVPAEAEDYVRKHADEFEQLTRKCYEKAYPASEVFQTTPEKNIIGAECLKVPIEQAAKQTIAEAQDAHSYLPLTLRKHLQKKCRNLSAMDYFLCARTEAAAQNRALAASFQELQTAEQLTAFLTEGDGVIKTLISERCPNLVGDELFACFQLEAEAMMTDIQTGREKLELAAGPALMADWLMQDCKIYGVRTCSEVGVEPLVIDPLTPAYRFEERGRASPGAGAYEPGSEALADLEKTVKADRLSYCQKKYLNAQGQHVMKKGKDMYVVCLKYRPPAKTEEQSDESGQGAGGGGQQKNKIKKDTTKGKGGVGEDGITGGKACGSDAECRKKALVPPADPGPDVSSFADETAQCPNAIGEYNCGMYSKQRGGLMRLADDDDKMERLCRAQVKKYFANRDAICLTFAGSDHIDQQSKFLALDKSLGDRRLGDRLSYGCPINKKLYDAMEADEVQRAHGGSSSAGGRPACTLLYEEILGQPLPDFKSREDISVMRTGGIVLQDLFTDMSNVLETDAMHELGVYAAQQTAVLALNADAGAALMAAYAFGDKANKLLALEGKVENIKEQLHCLPTRPKDQQAHLLKKLTKAREAIVEKFEDNQARQAGAERYIDQVTAQAGLIVELEASLKQTKIDLRGCSLGVDYCNAKRRQRQTLEKQINGLKSNLPMLSIEVVQGGKLMPLYKALAAVVSQGLETAATRKLAAININKAQNIGGFQTRQRLEDICGKPGDKKGYQRLVAEGRRVTAVDPVTQGFLACGDLDDGIAAQECADRRSFGWVFCRSYMGEVAQKNKQAMRKFYVTAAEIGVSVVLAVASAGTTAGAAFAAEEAVLIRAVTGEAASAVAGGATTAQRVVQVLEYGKSAYDIVKEHYEAPSNAVSEQEQRRVMTDFLNGWSTYEQFEADWKLANTSGQLALKSLGVKAISKIIGNEKFLRQLLGASVSEETISGLVHTIEVADFASDKGQELYKLVNDIVEQRQIFLDGKKVKMTKSQSALFRQHIGEHGRDLLTQSKGL